MSSQESNTYERLRNVISEQIGIQIEKIHPECQYVEDFGLDSLNLVEIAMGMEDEFNNGEPYPDEDLELLTTVQKTVDYLERKKILSGDHL